MIYLCGWHSLIFAGFHASFWKLFNWRATLKTTGRQNRVIMQVLNLRLIYIFLFTAFLCFFFPGDLYSTDLGRAFLIGMAAFWLGRTIEQFIFLRINHWLIHLLTVSFISGVILFLLPVIL
jgi:hypothetical protein